MIVAYSRPIAMKIYKRILELRPAWTEKIAVVMTQGNNDPEEWREIIGNKAHKDDMARKFKDNSSPLKIAIVVDMWLTGFDVPSLATMYVYKPMAGHNLMQAIARVNRVFKDKEGGLIVDYVGIAAALKQAMNDYTARDKKNYGDTDVSKAAYPKFLEKLSICRDLFHGFSYEKFMTGSDLDRAKLISGGVNFILGKSVAEYELPDNEKTLNVFIKEALLLKQALSLCSSLIDEKTRMEAAFFESVRTMTVRLVSGGTGKTFTLPEVNERINELLKHSIKSEGVINLFSNVQTEFSLFDPKFLEEIANMKEKNLAVELLKNQKFYHGQLIVMTKDHGEPDVLTMYRTTAGNHARGHLNQRQIDVIQREVLPRLHQQNFQSIGIITPYRDQVTAIRKQLGDTYEVDTVHKFQGREQDAIILTSVDNVITDFVDDPHMLNVAVSRAVHSLAVITSQDPRNDQTNYGDLARYIEYNNFEIIQSQIYSVFDMLYQGYAEQRREYLQKHKRVSEYDSENLMHSVIQEILSDEPFSSIGCAVHFSLATLVKDYAPLTEEERKYARNPLTHVDFLLFNQMDKQPVLAIEVDGTGFHEAGSKQAERDMKKNSILEKCGVPLLRLRTDGSGEKGNIRNALKRE